MPSLSTELLAWLTAYEPATLYTEDDVETKFVLPLFQFLGYPEQQRRGKYPIALNVGSKGRKHEVDQVYFATADPASQTLGNALIIVEAKRTSVDDLESAMFQAQSYSERLRPVLLVVTNGIHLLVLSRRRFGTDETVLDQTINSPYAVQMYTSTTCTAHTMPVGQPEVLGASRTHSGAPAHTAWP